MSRRRLADLLPEEVLHRADLPEEAAPLHLPRNVNGAPDRKRGVRTTRRGGGGLFMRPSDPTLFFETRISNLMKKMKEKNSTKTFSRTTTERTREMEIRLLVFPSFISLLCKIILSNVLDMFWKFLQNSRVKIHGVPAIVWDFPQFN